MELVYSSGNEFTNFIFVHGFQYLDYNLGESVAVQLKLIEFLIFLEFLFLLLC